MTGELYHAAARAKAAPPADWPAPALATWAGAAVRAAVAPVEAANLSLHWTRWQGVQETLGDLYSGTWGELCAWLDSTRAASVADKREVPPWAPARFDGDWRADDATLALYALALDCDDGGDWTALLAALDRAGLAYLAHRSPSHRDEGGPCKWRLILPLAAPVEGGALERWRNAYTAARLAFGALGRCWFDPTCGNPSRMWFAASAVGNAPRRELRKGQGRALDLLALLDRVPALPAPVRPELPRLDQGARRAPGGAPLDRVARAAAWLDKRDPAVQGQGGDQHTLATVAKVVRGFAVPDADAWPLLQAWNARCVPPWNDAELRDKMANAHKYGSEPYGATLDAPPPARQDRAELPRAAADWRAERGAGDPPGELDDAPPVEGDGGEPAPLAVPVEALGWLDLHPPPLPLLLACDDGTGGRAPFLALGKVALLAAPGGAGKTQALLQLAVAVASGRPWLDRYHVQAPGPVLFLAAEEDDGELHRRVRRVADALDLAPAERAAVARRLHCAPLHGKGAALALLDNAAHRFEPARLAPSAIWHRIAWTLETAPGGEPWRLVILDPAARWMPPDAELDPKIATTFVEVLEALAVCGLDGGPGAAVLVAHHANKQALRGDTDQGASRGTSALTDGVRWQANLDRVPLADGKPHPSRVRLRVVKCNYAPAVAFETLELEKDQDKGGVLCPCQDAVADAAGEKDDEALENHREKLNVRQAGVNERVRQADEVREKLRAHDEKEPPPLELEKRQAWQKARDRLVKDLEQAERSAKKARNDLLEKQAELAALERAQERNASKGGSKGSKGRDKAAGGGDDY